MHKLAHGVLTAIMIWLAYTFLEPTPTFTTASWSFMATLMDERSWGLACLIVGLFGSITAFTNNWSIRVLAAAVLSASHLGVAALVFLGNPHGAGSGLFFGYAVLGGGLAYSTAHLGERVKAGLEPPDFPGSLAR